MSTTIRALVILAALAAAFYPAVAEAKGPKQSAIKVHVCESVDLYFGPVTAGTKTERIAEACKDVSVSSASKLVAKCTAETPESCEVLQSVDHKTLMIEHKIMVSK